MVADKLHLHVRGDVEGLESLVMQLLDDVRGGVALDRIGQQAVEPLLEHLHRPVQLLGGEQETRKIRFLCCNQRTGVVIDRGRLSHWRLTFQGSEEGETSKALK